MTKTIELPEYYAPFGENARYGTLEVTVVPLLEENSKM